MTEAASLFSFKSQVRFTHTDPAGYVFFPRYFEMLQAVVEDWFALSLDLNYAVMINEQRLGTPTAAIQCTFMKPSRLGDVLTITVYLEHLGTSSFRVRFRGRVDNDLRLEAVSTLVMTNLDDGKPRPLPPDLRARMERYAELGIG